MESRLLQACEGFDTEEMVAALLARDAERWPALLVRLETAVPTVGEYRLDNCKLRTERRQSMPRVRVVKNRAGQYSIWPVDRENPLGWNDVGKSGSEAECQKYIEEVWTDMRPLSVRQRAQKLQEMKRKIGRG